MSKVLTVIAVALAAIGLSHAEVPTNPDDLFPEDKQSVDDSGKIIVQGAGASFPNRLYQAAIFAFQFSEAGEGTAVSYESTGSGKGLCRILDYITECDSPYVVPEADADLRNPIVVDFAGSDSILLDSQYEKFPDVQMYPAVAGAVVPIYNLPGSGNENLVIPREILPRMFRKCNETYPISVCGAGQIRYWDDPELVSAQTSENMKTYLNETLAGIEIEICVRADKSGTTEIFKKSLASMESTVFASQVGTLPTADWGTAAQVTKLNTNAGLAAYVSIKPYTLGYSVLGEAIALGLPTASISRGGRVVKASVEAVEFAVLEKGLEFGNNGDSPERLTADILDAAGSNSWPIVGFTYFVVRKNTLRPGATCDNVAATMKYLNWFYTNSIPASLARDKGFAPLPTNVRNVVLERLHADVTCNGSTVYVPPEERIYQPSVRVFGTGVMESLFSLFKNAYRSRLGSSNTIINDFQRSTDPVKDAMNAGGIALVHDRADHISDPSLVVLPFAGVAAIAIFNLCAVLDSRCENPRNIQLSMQTLARILNAGEGTPVRWNDPEIANSNPQVNLPDEPILVYGTTEKSSFMIDVELTFQSYINEIFEFKPRYTAKSEELVRSAVFATQYSLGFIVLSSPPDSFVGTVSVIRKESSNEAGIVPNVESIRACADGNYAPGDINPSLVLGSSSGTNMDNCYPLSLLISAVLPKDFASSRDKVFAESSATEMQLNLNPSQTIQLLESAAVTDSSKYCADGVASTEFLGWLYSEALTGDSGVDAPLETQEIAPLLVYPPGEDNLNIQVTKAALEGVVNCQGISILKDKTNFNYVSQYLIYTMVTLSVLALLFCIVTATWIHLNRKRKLIRAGSPLFLQQILFGAAIMACTIFPLSLQDDLRNPIYGTIPQQQLDWACRSQPFVFSIGFTIMFSALWLKTWRLNRIFNNPKLRRGRFINNRVLIAYEMCLLLIVVLLNVVWLMTDPLVYKRFTSEGIEVSNLIDVSGINTYGLCVNESNGVIAFLPLAISLFAFLLFGNWLTYRGRHIPSEFGEGKWLAIAMVTNLEAILLGVPIWILARTNPTSTYFVLSFVILVTSFGTIVIIFVPKVIIAYGWFGEKNSSVMRLVNDSSSRNGSLGGSSQSLTNIQRLSLYGDSVDEIEPTRPSPKSSFAFSRENGEVIDTTERTRTRTFSNASQGPAFAAEKRNSALSGSKFILDMLVKSTVGYRRSKDSRSSKELQV